MVQAMKTLMLTATAFSLGSSSRASVRTALRMHSNVTHDDCVIAGSEDWWFCWHGNMAGCGTPGWFFGYPQSHCCCNSGYGWVEKQGECVAGVAQCPKEKHDDHSDHDHHSDHGGDDGSEAKQKAEAKKEAEEKAAAKKEAEEKAAAKKEAEEKAAAKKEAEEKAAAKGESDKKAADEKAQEAEDNAKKAEEKEKAKADAEKKAEEEKAEEAKKDPAAKPAPKPDVTEVLASEKKLKESPKQAVEKAPKPPRKVSEAEHQASLP